MPLNRRIRDEVRALERNIKTIPDPFQRAYSLTELAMEVGIKLGDTVEAERIANGNDYRTEDEDWRDRTLSLLSTVLAADDPCEAERLAMTIRDQYAKDTAFIIMAGQVAPIDRHTAKRFVGRISNDKLRKFAKDQLRGLL